MSDIMKDSPARKTDIRKGDIVVSVDGTAIKDINHLRRVVAARKPGTTVKLAVFRNGKTVGLSMVLGELPEKEPEAPAAPGDREDYLGLVVKDIDEDLAFRHRAPDRKGVMITMVKRNSPAASAGLMAGDVIKELERTPVNTVKAYDDLIATLKGKKKILFLVARGGSHRFVVVDMEGSQ